MGVPPINRVGRIQRRICARIYFIGWGAVIDDASPRDAYPRAHPLRALALHEHIQSGDLVCAARWSPGRAVIIWEPNDELAERLAEIDPPIRLKSLHNLAFTDSSTYPSPLTGTWCGRTKREPRYQLILLIIHERDTTSLTEFVRGPAQSAAGARRH